MKSWASIVLFGLFFITLPHVALAHPGRTDAYGCHTCRTNCSNWGLSTGEYHCHNAKALPQPEAPIKSTYGESGTGYTSPAPEYAKKPKPIVTPASSKPISFPEKEPAIELTPEFEIEKAANLAPALIATVEPQRKTFISRFLSWLFSF